MRKHTGSPQQPLQGWMLEAMDDADRQAARETRRAIERAARTTGTPPLTQPSEEGSEEEEEEQGGGATPATPTAPAIPPYRPTTSGKKAPQASRCNDTFHSPTNIHIQCTQNTGGGRGGRGGSGGRSGGGGGGRGFTPSPAAPTGTAAHARRGRGSRGGTNPPQPIMAPSSAARVERFMDSIAPSAALGTSGDMVSEILNGQIENDFTRNLVAMPMGECTLNPLCIQTLWTFNFNGAKSIAAQQLSLRGAYYYPPNILPVFQGRRGLYFDAYDLVGTIYPVRATKDPGSPVPHFRLLSWLKPNGTFK